MFSLDLSYHLFLAHGRVKNVNNLVGRNSSEIEVLNVVDYFEQKSRENG